jgi:hypothetical protein
MFCDILAKQAVEIKKKNGSEVTDLLELVVVRGFAWMKPELPLGHLRNATWMGRTIQVEVWKPDGGYLMQRFKLFSLFETSWDSTSRQRIEDGIKPSFRGLMWELLSRIPKVGKNI